MSKAGTGKNPSVERCHGGEFASDLRCANEVIEALRSGAADKDWEWGGMVQMDRLIWI